MLGFKNEFTILPSSRQTTRRAKRSIATSSGFTLQSEFYRAERDSWKGDPALNGEYVIELFFVPVPSCAPKPSGSLWSAPPAFSVDDIDAAVAHLQAHGVACEAIRIDPFTDKRFTFFNDPDGLPLEIYQQ